MVIPDLASGSVEAALPFASHHGEQDFLSQWVAFKPWRSRLEQVWVPREGVNSCTNSGSSAMAKRRKVDKGLVVISSINPESGEAPRYSGVVNGPEGNVISVSDDGVEAPRIFVEKHMKDESANSEIISVSSDEELISDGFSSSISIRRISSLSSKTKLGDIEVCDAYGSEALDNDLSIRELCISVLKGHGLLVGDKPSMNRASTKVLEIRKDSNIFQSCEKCGKVDRILNMLLCDHCEEAFHLSCCKSRMKKPIDEWFCQSCSKLDTRASVETSFLKSPGISGWNKTSRTKLGPIAYMLKHPETYFSRVQIGESFQATIPEWPYQTSKGCDYVGEPVEMDPAETVSLNGCCTKKFREPGDISNWLQCREFLYDNAKGCVDEVICGKWRRAPLSEVQTDGWDCSCAVLWDPFHADCAVPQELETEQVLQQLKHIEQLRSRLGGKRRR